MGHLEFSTHRMMASHTPPIIASCGPYSMSGTAYAAQGGFAPGQFTVGANAAIAVPFLLPAPATVKKMHVANGGAVGGSIDVGVYDDELVRKVSSGAIIQGAINTHQIIDVTDTYLPAGIYYMAVAVNNPTSQLWRVQDPAGAGGVGNIAAGGTVSAPSHYPLPTTFSPTGYQSYVPILGVDFKGWL